MTRHPFAFSLPPFPLLFFLLLPFVMLSSSAVPVWQESTSRPDLNILKEAILYCRAEKGNNIDDCYKALVQDKAPKVAAMNIQMAIAQSKDGQDAAKKLQAQFAPKRAELEKQQKEINALKNELREKEKSLSEDARKELIRKIDDKTAVFNGSNDKATVEFQKAEQDAINAIGRKMLDVIYKHAKKNAYDFVLDSQFPKTYIPNSSAAVDITKRIMEEYNKSR